MKNLGTLVISFLVFANIATADLPDRVYIPKKNISFTDIGIFYKSDCALVELENISFDYDAQSYYLTFNDSQRRTIVNCNYCGDFTWWVQGHCCLNDDCNRACF